MRVNQGKKKNVKTGKPAQENRGRNLSDVNGNPRMIMKRDLIRITGRQRTAGLLWRIL